MNELYGGSIGPKPSTTFIQLILEATSSNPSEIFLIDAETGKEWRYEEALQRVLGVASYLQELGLGPGKTISICTHISAESIIFSLASWLIGASVNFLSINRAEDEQKRMLQIVAPNLVWFETEEDAFEYEDAIVLTGLPRPGSHLFKLPQVDTETHIPLMLFTSGTTGFPKVICIKDIAICRYLTKFENSTEIKKALLTSDPAWISFSFILLQHLVNGISIIMPKKKFTHEDILKTIDRYKPDTWVTGGAVLWDLIYNKKRTGYDLSSLKAVVCGGSRLPAKNRRTINKELFGDRLFVKHLYALTELGAITKWSDKIDISSDEYESVGVPVAGVTIKVVDLESGAALGPGERGEICVKTATMMAGILHTRLEDIEEIDADGWFHTGDIGFYDKKGLLYVVSRLKELLKWRGNMISSAEIEKLLESHEGVKESCVVGIDHETEGQRPAAAVVLKPGVKATAQEIEQFVADNTPDYKKLRGGVIFVESIPKNQNGKTLRNRVQNMFMNK